MGGTRTYVNVYVETRDQPWVPFLSTCPSFKTSLRFSLCVCLCAYVGIFPWRPEEDIRYPRVGVTGGRELPCGCWQPGLGLLQEQQVIVTAEMSLQPIHPSFLFV